MPNIRMIKSVINEYGFAWLANRSLYSAKLKMMGIIPASDKLFEKKIAFPKRIDLFEVDVKALQVFLKDELSEEDKKKIIDIANKACDGIVTGFSSIELNYGNPINWQLNPLTGKTCDGNQKWYRIPDFDEERGDIKVVWEASRFSHFISLARAFLLTDDKKYYEAFSTQLKSWLDMNAYGFGANYKCGQECSFRMVNGLLAYTVFNTCGVTKPADAVNIKHLVFRCYKKVLSNFFYAYKCIKNNHTISELMGMIVGAWCCEDSNQIKKAYRLLDEVIDEQFTTDGGYRQFSFNYQRLALQDLECVLSISEKTGINLHNDSKEKIKNAALLMFQCQDETDDMPNYGANDGALVFPVTSCGYRNYSPVINTVYALIKGKELYDEGNHQEELIWFSGGKSLQEYKTEIKKRTSSQYSDAGLFTIRGNNSWVMIVSNEYRSRPAHMDQLHLDLWIEGVNVLCDTGSYSYASNEGRELVRNESHNTAVLEGVTQMNSSGPFMIFDWTKRELGTCDDTSFAGKMISANGYTHVREVKQIGVSYEITDMVDEDCVIAFHTPCDVKLENGKAVLSKDGKLLCVIRSSGELKVKKSQRSLYYLKKENIKCLSIIEQAGTRTKTIIEVKGENDR